MPFIDPTMSVYRIFRHFCANADAEFNTLNFERHQIIFLFGLKFVFDIFYEYQ